jgi:hypothetical protein
MTQVVLGPTLFQGLGLEGLKGQLLLVPSALTSSHLFVVTLNNV